VFTAVKTPKQMVKKMILLFITFIFGIKMKLRLCFIWKKNICQFCGLV